MMRTAFPASHGVPPIPPVTRNLLIAIAAVFIIQVMSGETLLDWFALWPLGHFQPWQLLSYGFLHGDFMHLLFNAIGLWQFGSRVELHLGARRYLQFFLVCVVGAGLCQLAVVTAMVSMGNPGFPTVGASGGIFGILLAYALFFPHDRMIIIPIPAPISARTVVIGYGVISLVAGITGTLQGIAHFAHLGGMLFGWLLIRYWRGQPPFKRKPPTRPNLRGVR